MIYEGPRKNGCLSVPQYLRHLSFRYAWPWLCLCEVVCAWVCVCACVYVWPQQHGKLLSLCVLCCGGNKIASQHSYFQSSAKHPSSRSQNPAISAPPLYYRTPSSPSRKKKTNKKNPKPLERPTTTNQLSRSEKHLTATKAAFTIRAHTHSEEIPYCQDSDDFLFFSSKYKWMIFVQKANV